MLKKMKNIIFDFDGVIIDSMKVRIEGIKKIMKKK
jgi:beta-phosphoglucomutase-like phosphatase (HAD superfamily)